MSEKLYGAFIVSKEPIDLGNLADNPAVTQLVNEEFEMESRDDGNWHIKKSVPHHFDRDGEYPVRGRGISVSMVILDWFDSLCRAVTYLSLERKRKDRQP